MSTENLFVVGKNDADRHDSHCLVLFAGLASYSVILAILIVSPTEKKNSHAQYHEAEE